MALLLRQLPPPSTSQINSANQDLTGLAAVCASSDPDDHLNINAVNVALFPLGRFLV